MENILAIDTTSNLASTKVAVLNNNKITKASYNENDKLITHSEKLFPIIDKSLKDINLNINDINVCLTTNGPGSFTVSRIRSYYYKRFNFSKKPSYICFYKFRDNGF